jgi:thioredoxin-related protein
MMGKNFKQFCFALSVYFASSPLWGASLYSITLDSLTQLDTIAFEEYREKYLVLTIFEPECPWCMKQFKALETLYSTCHSKLQPIGVGIGSKKGLKDIVYRTKITFPAGQASSEFIELFGQPSATPFSIIVNEKGDLVTTLQGYIPLEKLTYAFQDICTQE